MALRWPSGVPVTDLSLVLGDTVPVRIRVDHALTDCTPALAVKQTIGSADLIMTVTGFVREDDWQTADWVVNTVPLQEALGSADSVALVAEVVLVAPDGAQHTSRPIRVTVRRDILPADYAPPAEVLADWHELITAALASQLPDALHEAGMYVTPATGTATLESDMGARQLQAVTYYRLPLNHHNIVGHIASRYEVQSITIRSLPDQNNPEIYIELYKLAADNYELLGRSLQSIKPTAPNQDYTWAFPPGMMVRHDDVLIVRIVGTDGNDAVITLWGTNIGTLAGAGIVDGLASPQLQHDSFFLNIKFGVTYADGVSVGGVELATRDHFDALVQTVVITGEQVTMDAEAALTAKEGAQAILNAMPSQDQFDARYGSLGKSNTWAGAQAINGAISVGTGDDLNLYIHASGGPSASLSIAEMRIYRGNNDGNFYVDTGIGSSLYFDRGVYFYDAVNFASGVTMSQSLNVVGGLTATDNTTNLGNVITANISVQRVDVAGPASFSYGVTMAQSLTVEGQAIIKTGLNVGEDLSLYGSDGLPGGSLRGFYESPDESIIIIKDAGAREYMSIGYDANTAQASLNLIGSAASLALPEKLVGPVQFFTDDLNYVVFGITYDQATGWHSRTDFRLYANGGIDVADGAVFHSGVTMGQSLNVSGVATMYRCAVYDAAYSLLSVMTGEAVWQNKSSGTFSLRGDDDGLMGVTLTIGRNDREAARVIKQNQHTPLSQTDVPNLAEGDARWVKFNNTLTAAQYAALAVKDQTTLYITSDTRKIYFGSYALN